MKRKYTFPANFLRQKKPDRVISAPLPLIPPPPNRMWIDRLSWPPSQPIALRTDQDVAGLIKSSSLPQAAFFVDTSFLRAPISPVIWDALSKREVHVTKGVVFEIAQWMSSPNSNTACNREIIDAILRSDCQFIQPNFAETLPAPLWFGFNYYQKLLMLRKLVGTRFCDRFRGAHGRFPTVDEFFSGFKKQGPGFDDMAARIAWKGFLDRNKPNYNVDESLVLQAIVFALQSGRETVILTRDHDLPIQFYKAIFLLDTHYRSMLAALRISQSPSRFRHLSFNDLHPSLQQHFDRAFQGLDKTCFLPDVGPHDFFQQILPSQYSSVVIECWWIAQGPETLQFSRQAFCAEDHMLQLMIQKGIGQGRNTSLFEDRNCHNWSVPWKGCASPGIVVAEDKKIKLTPDLEFRYIDMIHAVESNEGYTIGTADGLPPYLNRS